MPERWAVNLAEALRQNGNGDAAAWEPRLGRIGSANPLSLLIGGKTITRSLYVNPAFILDASDGIDKIEQNFQGAPEPDALFEFLKIFHQQFVLRRNDEVIVLQSGASFYILQKVVAAT